MQQISIVFSLLSLAWGASRGYFIQRSQDAADPNPALGMVVMRVFPLMLVIVLNSLVLWVFIGGFLGPWIFPPLHVNFLIIFCSLKGGKILRKRRMRRMGRMRRNALVTQRTTWRLEPRDNYFMLKDFTFSVWLPSVVGNITKFPEMFIISSVASLAAKVATLTAQSFWP